MENMYSTMVLLNSIENVKKFISIVDQCPYDVDLVSGRYVIDAKSIMGIFSLDLSKPIPLHVHVPTGEETKFDESEFMDKLTPFIYLTYK